MEAREGHGLRGGQAPTRPSSAQRHRSPLATPIGLNDGFISHDVGGSSAKLDVRKGKHVENGTVVERTPAARARPLRAARAWARRSRRRAGHRARACRRRSRGRTGRVPPQQTYRYSKLCPVRGPFEVRQIHGGVNARPALKGMFPQPPSCKVERHRSRGGRRSVSTRRDADLCWTGRVARQGETRVAFQQMSEWESLVKPTHFTDLDACTSGPSMYEVGTVLV